MLKFISQGPGSIRMVMAALAFVVFLCAAMKPFYFVINAIYEAMQ